MRTPSTRTLFCLTGAVALGLMGCQADPISQGSTSGPVCGTTQTQTAEDAGAQVGIHQLSQDRDDVAQAFNVTQTAYIANISLKLQAERPPQVSLIGNLDLTLVEDSQGIPSATPIAQATLNAATVTTDASAFYTFNLPSVVTLAAGQKYWILLTADYPASDTQYVSWMAVNRLLFTNATSNYRVGTSWDAFTPQKTLLFNLGCGSTTPAT